MNKKILSALIGLTFATGSSATYADDLAQIFQLALQNDPTLKQAQAQRDAARQGVDIAQADWWPQVGFEAGYSRSTRETQDFDSSGNIFMYDITSSGWSAGVNLSQTLFSKSVWEQTAIAEKQAYQAEVSYLSERQQLMIRVVNAYFTVLERKDDLEFAQAEKRAIERQLEQTKQRFSVGLTAITDVHEAQAQFDNAVAREIQAQNAVEIAQEGLREITGRYHQDIAELDTENFSPSAPNPENADNWVTTAEDKNLQLLVQRVAVEISDQRIDLALAGHYPRVSLSGSFSTQDSESEVLGRTSNPPRMDSSSIGVSLNVPLFSGFRTSSQADQARANYVASSQQLEFTRRNVEREVRSSYYDVVAAIATIRALEQAVISAESALKATQTGFEVGTRTIVDVLDSTRNLFNARRNLSTARYNYIRQSLTLQQASGKISEQDLMAINASLINENN
ncbi:outer membrane channel protein TolC [Pseudidiomarina sp. 1APP75-32.1]|uniref:Outer membrane channel protein TolC n=1 Tax=Pseudidiomarina terrestris TaxID=2820060 RepID=A0AAW7QWK7_9GAMM|nr:MULTISPECIES: outer membrane channel protein TolC [unclassified Pseudidiomarina]MDN7123816.1 outer membrane channel protein TolC [Pseudidiomarina sp. 1APP75-32.1]MDN7130316.1 outer membrane channel protein TolC [Pseudidiomarina sp. 1APR75-15]MDN7138844.1 outer membrane channel protein TolC [Pseudidiomarina sp. 1ASP75-14]MEA3588693.1 outer membrane channel protein TolC [Pseudidiomarina sp. 1APP75-27a]